MHEPNCVDFAESEGEFSKQILIVVSSFQSLFHTWHEKDETLESEVNRSLAFIFHLMRIYFVRSNVDSLQKQFPLPSFVFSILPFMLKEKPWYNVENEKYALSILRLFCMDKSFFVEPVDIEFKSALSQLLHENSSLAVDLCRLLRPHLVKGTSGMLIGII